MEPTTPLADTARSAVAAAKVKYASVGIRNSDDGSREVARAFLSRHCPDFINGRDDVANSLCEGPDGADRLVKIGRGIVGLFVTQDGSDADDVPEAAALEQSLGLTVTECEWLCKIHYSRSEDSALKVPKVRFGKTGLEISIATLGCMRFQQSWNRSGTTPVLEIPQVEADNQDGLVRILRYCLKVGINHIETARFYGSSELQLGAALKVLFDNGECTRDDWIIQTKVPVVGTRKAFLGLLETSMKLLGVDYVDMMAFHGLNNETHLRRVLEHEDGGGPSLMTSAEELQKSGKIRHIGFSTHARSDVIRRALESKKFSYVNLHYHFCGSYTTTGEAPDGGNLPNVRLAKELDIGLFVISPFDKGGRLYAPSRTLRGLCLPDMEPLAFGAAWLWSHGTRTDGAAPVHTITCGAARPSDLDGPVALAVAHFNRSGAAPDTAVLDAVTKVSSRLEQEVTSVLHSKLDPESSLVDWYAGLHNGFLTRYGTHISAIVWYAIMIEAWGMVGYGRDRYESFESNGAKWDYDKSRDENIKKQDWGFMPGCAVVPGTDYAPDLTGCPPSRVAALQKILEFSHHWLCKEAGKDTTMERRLPVAWEDAYDMRPWTATCER